MEWEEGLGVRCWSLWAVRGGTKALVSGEVLGEGKVVLTYTLGERCGEGPGWPWGGAGGIYSLQAELPTLRLPLGVPTARCV